MSYRQKLLATRLAGLESHQEDVPGESTDAVQAAVDQVADKIVEAAAEQAAEQVEAVVDGGEGESEDAGAEAVAEETGGEGEGAAEVAEGEEGAGEGAGEEGAEAAEEGAGESEDAGAEEGEGSDEEPTLDSGAEEILEINAEGDEVEAEEDAADETAEIAEGLESIALAMESTLANGGLTPMAAQGYHIAVESYLSRAQLPNTAIPSLESFGGSGTRVQYTQVSVENIREKAGQLWQALLAMLEKAKEMAFNFFKKVFTMTGQLKAKAEGILKAAKDLGAKSAEEVGGGSAAKLTIGGKVPVGLAGELKKLGKLLTDSYSYSDAAVGYASAVTQGLSSVDAGNDEKFSAGIKDLVEKAAKATPAFEAAGSEYRGNESGGVGMVGKQTEAHVGEVKVVAVRLGDANIDQAAAIRGIAGQRNIVDIGSAEATEKLPTLNEDQIKGVALAVLDIIDAVDGYKDTAAKVDKALGDVTKGGKAFQRIATKAESLSGENKKLVNPLMGVVKSVPAVVSQPAQKLTQHSLSVCQAALKYCADSIKAHGKQAPAEDAEAAAA